MTVSACRTISIEELSRIVPLVEIPTADQPEIDDRRARRFEPAGPIEVILTHADGREQVGLLADISAVGARIIADESPRDGSIIELSLPLGSTLYHIGEGFVLHTEASDLGCFGVNFDWAQEPVTIAIPLDHSDWKMAAHRN